MSPVRFLVAPLKAAECSAVGSALRSGRRGRAFESPHSDKVKGSFLEYSKLPFIIFRLSGRNRNRDQRKNLRDFHFMHII